MKNNPVFRVAAKILFAPIILFGLYVQFHGDFGPGGGFQAGVIAAAFIPWIGVRPRPGTPPCFSAGQFVGDGHWRVDLRRGWRFSLYQGGIVP